MSAIASHVSTKAAGRRVRRPGRRLVRAWSPALVATIVSTFGVVVGAAGVVGTVGATPAAASPNPPAARVYLRVEGAQSTIFDGWVTTTPHDVTTPSGGTHECDGLNNNANPTAGPTATTALADAASADGFTFDGPWDPQFNDFTITRAGSDAQTATQFWGVLDNYKFTPVSGCQAEVKDGDQVLWAFDAFNKNHFLKLTGPTTATTDVPFTVTVTDGSTGQPVQGATVWGQTSAADGTVSLTSLAAGSLTLKATKADSVRSNALVVNVTSPTTTTTVSSSANPSTPGQDVTFNAVVSPSDGNGTVGFFADGSGTAITGCAAVALHSLGAGNFGAACDAGTGLTAGNHPIHVVYSGDDAYQGSSGDLTGGQQVGKASQKITFPPLASRSIVESPFTLSGVTGGGSGNPVTFTSSGQCSVAGSTVTLHKTGKCTLTAHQAGNAQYSAAPNVTRAFTITPKPALRIGDASTLEGNSGTHPLNFPVTLSKAVSVPVTVAWKTANKSATAPSDFIAASGTLTFAPGQTSGTIPVQVKGDLMKESDETFVVLLSNPRSATIVDGSATGTILNDD